MNKSIMRDRFFDLLIPSAIFFSTILIFGYFSTIGADPHHDGIVFKPALDVASGQMLFRDTFTEYGALPTLIEAGSLVLFGKYLITIKLLTAFFYGLISILLYFILKKIIPKSVVFASLIIWILLSPNIMIFRPWSSVYALFFQLLGTWLLLIALETNTSKFIFLGGVSTALVFWCRQPVGIFMLFAVIAFYFYLFFSTQIKVNELRRYLFYYIVGNVLANVLFVIWLAANNAFFDWWKQTMLLPFFWAMREHAALVVGHAATATATSSASVASGSLGQSLSVSTSRGITASGPMVYLVSALLYGWPLLPICAFVRNLKNPAVALLVFVSLASGLQFYPAHDICHCYWGGTPMLGLMVLLLYQYVSNFKIFRNAQEKITIVTLVIIFLPGIIFFVKSDFKRINSKYYFIDQPAVLKNLRLSKEEADFYIMAYQQIEKYFVDYPKGNVIIDGQDILCLTLDARIKNFHPVYVGWLIVGELIYPDYPRQRKQYIETKKPLILHFDPEPLNVI